ncbi:MAG: hypothetical protein KDD10_30485 [Phaeodactylibacter sp.]|nr:hypothetical protein [Phaeodactylibacter sp.]
MATTKTLKIDAPKFGVLAIEIEGTAPYMQAKFSAKTKQAMKEKMEAGSTARSKRKRDSRDFENDFLQAQHFSDEGWNGIPAAAFRNACIDACRMVGYKMTHARMSIFAEADGYDADDGTPLVQIVGEAPKQVEMSVRNATGVVDIRVRPMWRKWSAIVRVRYDEGQFTAEDVTNLMLRAGQQVGIGEGRPFSKSSNGLGYGLFKIKNVSYV